METGFALLPWQIVPSRGSNNPLHGRATAARPTRHSRPKKSEVDGQNTKPVLGRRFLFLNKSLVYRYTCRETSYLVVVFFPLPSRIQPTPCVLQTDQIQTSKPRCAFPVLFIAATLMSFKDTDLLHSIYSDKMVWRKNTRKHLWFFDLQVYHYNLDFETPQELLKHLSAIPDLTEEPATQPSG